MAFLQKTWKDRVAEYINRRVLTKEDGTTELVSVERSEGTISQEGDAFSAANMNDLEQRIANEFSEQNKNLGGLRFGVDGDGNYGYYGADDSLIPFKSYEIVEGTFSGTSFTVNHNLGRVPSCIMVRTNPKSGTSNGEIVLYNKYFPQAYKGDGSGEWNWGRYMGAGDEGTLNLITNITETSFKVTLKYSATASYHAFVCA